MSNIFKRAKGDMHYLFKDTKKLPPKARKRKKRAKKTVLGLFLILIQLVIMALFLFRILTLSILPMNYLLILIGILLLLTLYCFFSQFTKAQAIGKLLSILMSAILLFGFLFSSKVAQTFDALSSNTKTDIIDVVVLRSDNAASIPDALGYTFGYNNAVNTSITQKAIEKVEKDNNTSLKTKTYSEWSNMVKDLYGQKEVKALFIDDGMLPVIGEEITDFTDKTKVIGQITITTKLALSSSDKKVTQEPFIIYLSGNDGYGTVSSNGRSDVNILACINPKTKQVLLVSTPRDYYIDIENADGKSGLDKLTHAGNAGVEYSMKALENLYNISIDYYVKLNFTGCVKVVDALGGITVYSEKDFTNGQDAAPVSYHFVQGENECDGEKTLAFVRERHVFGNGDFQRGRNQSAAISGIIDKATSPAILGNYNAVLSSVSNMFLTSMPPASITALIKHQLSDGSGWNVQSYSAEGEPSTRNCTVYNVRNASVVLPNYDSVNKAIELMGKINAGEIFDVDEYLANGGQN